MKARYTISSLMLISLFVGLCTAVLLLTVDLAMPKTDQIVDAIFKPGEICAIYVFGGLHGLWPLLLAVFVEGVIFGALLLSVTWGITNCRSFFRSTSDR